MSAWWTVVVVVGLAGGVAGWPASAVASEGGTPTFTVSTDGLTWSSDLSAPLFDDSARWVPGDERTSSFLVRNDGREPASVSIEPRDLGTRTLTAQGDVELFARSDGGAWRPLGLGQQSPPLDAAALPAGAVTRVDVRASFDRSATNQTQLQEARLSFVVRLTGVTSEQVPTGSDDGVGTAGTGTLGATGAPETRLALVVAGVLIGSGLALVRRRGEARRG